jgi:hypothetical protein
MLTTCCVFLTHDHVRASVALSRLGHAAMLSALPHRPRCPTRAHQGQEELHRDGSGELLAFLPEPLSTGSLIRCGR